MFDLYLKYMKLIHSDTIWIQKFENFKLTEFRYNCARKNKNKINTTWIQKFENFRIF